MDGPLATGALLVATPLIRGGVFGRCVVLLLDHDDEGSLGVVLTAPGAAAAAGVLGTQSARAAVPAVVFHGGPVQPEVVLAVAVDTDGRIGWGPLQAEGDLPTGDLRVFAGYAGWSPGQLAAELAEGAWWVLPGRPGDLLPGRPAELWRTLVGRLPAPACYAATLPADPTDN